MPPDFSQTLLRRIGMVLFLGLLAMIVYGVLVKQPWPSDFMFWLPRWPVWLFIGVGMPLVALCVALLRQRRRDAARQAPPP
jgi:hypothetical protein